MSLMSDIGAVIKTRFDRNASAMTKAQFNALAEERKANRAGSGFDKFGSNHSIYTTNNVNKGLYTPRAVDNLPNQIWLSMEDTSSNKTSDGYPVIVVGGVKQKLKSIGAIFNKIQLPTAPNIHPFDAILTAEQIESGVIKHAAVSNSGLITNGKFDTGTSGWTANGILIVENGRAKHTVTTTTQFFQGFNTVIGRRYIIEFSSEGQCTPYISTNANSSGSLLNLGFKYRTGIRESYEFVATTTVTYFVMYSTVNESTYHDNIAVYPADAISRSDLVFQESYHEDIGEKNFVYPLGNIQYLGGNTDGLTVIANGNFTGFETYSLFGKWQTPSALIGTGYAWGSLTEAQKRAFIANPENNCYLDGDKTMQARYRVRVVQGWGDIWGNTDPQTPSGHCFLAYDNSGGVLRVYAKGKAVSNIADIVRSTGGLYDDSSYFGKGATGTTLIDSSLLDNGIFSVPRTSTSKGYEAKCFALPIALVHRRNQGMYHNVYNPNGAKLASDGLDCFRTTISFTSISDCFDPAKLLTASGYIGTVSGRPDGLFYDQVHESDIQDLRNSSKKSPDKSRLISREFNKLVTGTYRGSEGEKYTEITTQTTTGTVATVQVKDGTRYRRGDVVFIYDLTASSVKGRFVVISISANTLTVDTAFAKLANSYMISGASTTRTKSNTILSCDVIGNPANYPLVWKTNEGVFTTLHTAEDGTSLLPDGIKGTFKLSRKANATPLLCLRSTDNGATWASFTPTFSTTTNAITLTDEPANNLVMVYYQTKTAMGTPVVNSEVIEIGKVLGTDGLANGALISTLIGKVPTANTAPYLQDGYNINAYRIDASTLKFSTTSTENPVHSALSLAGGAVGVPAVKVLPYLTRTNGKAYLNLVFKEMKHNGTSWGDSNTFNIVDNVSTTIDLNAQTVLIGQKGFELPYFLGADE